jgi:hypothetical protein
LSPQLNHSSRHCPHCPSLLKLLKAYFKQRRLASTSSPGNRVDPLHLAGLVTIAILLFSTLVVFVADHGDDSEPAGLVLVCAVYTPLLYFIAQRLSSLSRALGDVVHATVMLMGPIAAYAVLRLCNAFSIEHLSESAGDFAWREKQEAPAHACMLLSGLVGVAVALYYLKVRRCGLAAAVLVLLGDLCLNNAMALFVSGSALLGSMQEGIDAGGNRLKAWQPPGEVIGLFPDVTHHMLLTTAVAVFVTVVATLGENRKWMGGSAAWLEAKPFDPAACAHGAAALLLTTCVVVSFIASVERNVNLVASDNALLVHQESTSAGSEGGGAAGAAGAGGAAGAAGAAGAGAAGQVVLPVLILLCTPLAGLVGVVLQRAVYNAVAVVSFGFGSIHLFLELQIHMKSPTLMLVLMGGTGAAVVVASLRYDSGEGEGWRRRGFRGTDTVGDEGKCCVCVWYCVSVNV